LLLCTFLYASSVSILHMYPDKLLDYLYVVEKVLLADQSVCWCLETSVHQHWLACVMQDACPSHGNSVTDTLTNDCVMAWPHVWLACNDIQNMVVHKGVLYSVVILWPSDHLSWHVFNGWHEPLEVILGNYHNLLQHSGKCMHHPY
jgi:hypothetical protein